MSPFQRTLLSAVSEAILRQSVFKLSYYFGQVNGPGENRTPVYRMQTGYFTTELRALLSHQLISFGR